MNIERVKGSTNRFGALGGTRGRCLGTLGGCRIHRRSFGAFAGLAGARIKASTTRFGALGGCRLLDAQAGTVCDCEHGCSSVCMQSTRYPRHVNFQTVPKK
eukprot:scaffold8969_cov145-Skeletonema_menzelii.AAC.1